MTTLANALPESPSSVSSETEPAALRPNGSADEAHRGEVRFIGDDELTRLRGALEAARLLFVRLTIGPGGRGRLAEVIEEAVEQALRDRGGAPPGIGASADQDASLSDQLYRVRKIGRMGLAIALGPLGALTDARGALEPEDAASLRFLRDATRDRPLFLLLDRANVELKAYGPPLPLREALGLTPPAPLAPSPTSSPSPSPSPSASPTPATLATKAQPPKPEPRAESPRVYVTIERAAPIALSEAASRLAEIARTTPLTAFERTFVEAYVPLRAALLEERLGGSGVARNEARALCSQFVTTFSRAYAEALPTFGVTGRHPRMLFELFDLAQRCARVHGARSTHVVIVDAMRFDLARRVRDRMAERLARQAVCVEEHALWAVLPTTTGVQLDALVRGEDALRAPMRQDREAPIVRGRSLDVLRRIRLGHRDVVKLDLLEGRLRDSGPKERERLDGLADELTPILSKYVSSSKPRALVVIAGDHGFTFGDEDAREEKNGTPAARQGGGSPDEVFVPFHAWLVGGVH